MGFASVWVGAWLFGVWLSGSRWVYGDTVTGGRSATALDAPWAVRGDPPAQSADSAAPIERVVGRDPFAGGLASFEPRHPASYALDARSREVTGRCPEVPLTEFAGNAIPLAPGARVTPAFRERLLELEDIVSGLSQVFYGRLPSAILVASSYDCRSVSGKNQRLSEHALGNAIDITGFRFAALTGAPTATDGFEVRVDQHWKATGDAERVRHARFLDVLTQALLARDVFRTLLGPSHPDHADHFHFDMAPSYYVDL
jgi:hypothetical protein